MSEERVRIGVVGCGRVAQVMHLPHLRELSGRFELAALCDLSPAVVGALGEIYGCDRTYTEIEEFLRAPMDAVLIASHSATHAALAIAAADRGLHVLTEKPMSRSVSDAIGMVAAADKAGVVLMVGFMKRYDPAYERFRSELKGVHDIKLIRTLTLESPIPPYLDHHPIIAPSDVPPEIEAATTAQDLELIRSVLGVDDPFVLQTYRAAILGSFIHELNLLRGLFGDPDELLYADLRSDGLTVLFRFGDTRCVCDWVDLRSGMTHYVQEVSVYSPARRASLVFPSPYLKNAPTEIRFQDPDSAGHGAWQRIGTVSFEEAFKRELIEFHRCIQAGGEPVTSGRDSVGDIALAQAIVRCHQGRQSIPRPASFSPE